MPTGACYLVRISRSASLAKSASEFVDHIAGCHYPRHWIRARRPAALLLSWGLPSQPRSPKCLGHRVAAGRHGIASACTRLGRSETLLRFRWGDFGACCGRPRFQSLIEPHCQRNPSALRVDLQHFDMDDIAGLRNFAWVLDVSWSAVRYDGNQFIRF